MKTLKFLFVAVLLSCFVGITQTNAQPTFFEGTQSKAVVYEVDGVEYYGVAEVEFHALYIPRAGILNWVAHGYLFEASEYDNGVVGALLDYIPLPKKNVKGYDPNIVYYEKITVGPDGKVLINAHLPVFRKFDPLY